MQRIHLFIDTNVLLNFYHYADDDLGQLEQLMAVISDVDVCLHLPQQVINELSRNREAKMQAAIAQFNKEPVPLSVPRFMQHYAQSADYIKAAEDVKRLRLTLVTLANADASTKNLATDKMIDLLITKATLHNEDSDIFEVALQRMQKGNPPGKVGSVGDQYNWETLLHKLPDEDLHIVTKDGDYASLLNKSRPNPMLEDEWKTKKKAQLYIYKELRAFLSKRIELRSQPVVAPTPVTATPAAPTPATPTPVTATPAAPTPATPTPVTATPAAPTPVTATPVTATPATPTPVTATPVTATPVTATPAAPTPVALDPDTERRKQTAMQTLIDSPSFSHTHVAISQLLPFRASLSRSDAELLIDAAVNNVQIKWIATDSDVYAFYSSLLTEHSDIREDLFEEAIDVFGLRPEPDDTYDDI
jgi:hypothetical protein